jgi:hypothetical protein
MQHGTKLATPPFEEVLSDLLLDLYEAAVDQDHWQVFLDRLCTLTDTISGFMLAVDPEQGNITLAGGGLDFNPEILHLYNEYYGLNDPYAPPLMANPRIGVIQAEEVLSRSDLYRSELYNELLRPNNLGYMTLLSSGRPDEACPIPLWRSPKQGPMDTASIELLRMLLPHVRTALRLRNKVRASNAYEHFSEAALDAMSSTAVFLVTSAGHVRHMNKLAAVHLQQGDGLRLSNSKLSTLDPHESAQLESLIAGAAARGKSGLNAAPGGAMKVSPRNGQDALQVTIIPAPDSLKEIEVGGCALVFVPDPFSLPKPRAAFMRQLYALTPTEARLADLMLQGFDVREAAEQLQTTLETARFHL